MNEMTQDQWKSAVTAALRKSASDASFRARCLSTPVAALKDASGLDIPSDAPIKFVERLDAIVVVLPPVGTHPDEISVDAARESVQAVRATTAGAPAKPSRQEGLPFTGETGIEPASSAAGSANLSDGELEAVAWGGVGIGILIGILGSGIACGTAAAISKVGQAIGERTLGKCVAFGS
jgi:hypothetical protein